MNAPINIKTVAKTLNRYSRHPSSYLCLNEGVQSFQSNSFDGLISYRDQGAYRICVAGICAPESTRKGLFDEFMEKAKFDKKRVMMVQCNKSDACFLNDNGFVVNQLGTSYFKSITDYSLGGKRFVKLRNKISQARRSGVIVEEVGVDVPASTEIDSKISIIDVQWLKSKGAAELDFLIGELNSVLKDLSESKRLFIARLQDEIVGYILYSQTYGQYSGWMHDLTRRKNDCPNGVMELINDTAINKFKTEGWDYLHFGFTPLADLNEESENGFRKSGMFTRIAKWLSKHGAFIYPMETQLSYKKKWYPDENFYEYVAFEDRFRLGGLWQFLKLTKIV